MTSQLAKVSIHAPRVRGDPFVGVLSSRFCFNSRPSCEGRHIRDYAAEADKFQFTPLV